MIPLLHDFDGETVFVAGGGPVGARKARRFAREATVVVASPSFADADFGDAERVKTTLTPESAASWVDRTDPVLVVIATDDPDLNDALADAARDDGALVNRADQSGGVGEDGVVVPATVRDDPVVVAVATGGASPALSRYLRQQIEPTVESAGAMATLSGQLREEMRAADFDAQARREAIRAVVRSGEVWTALDRGSPNSRATAVDVIEATTGDRL